jgi:hypothetical protein
MIYKIKEVLENIKTILFVIVISIIYNKLD